MIKNEKEQIGERLVNLRKAFGWSATYLAQVCDVTPQRWYNYETARNEPPRVVLQKLKLLTGVTSDYILFGDQSALPFDLAIRLSLTDGKSAKDQTA